MWEHGKLLVCDWNCNHIILPLLQNQLSFSTFFFSISPQKDLCFPSCVCFRCFSLWRCSSACVNHYCSSNQEKSKGQPFGSTFSSVSCISHVCAFTKGNKRCYGDRPALLREQFKCVGSILPCSEVFVSPFCNSAQWKKDVLKLQPTPFFFPVPCNGRCRFSSAL